MQTSLWHWAKSRLRRVPWPFGSRSFGLNGLDLKLLPYLNFDNGFFVEAGANDGVAQSNTFYYERYHKWTGILIEPIPFLAETCRSNRPHCRTINTALVPFDYRAETIGMNYCNLMSLVTGAMRSGDEEREHLRRGSKVQRIESYPLTVPAMTLTSVLDACSVPRFDLLSLDVEGFEACVLRGLDFDRYRPRFILVEARYRPDVEAVLFPLYETVAELSHHDVLYRLTKP